MFEFLKNLRARPVSVADQISTLKACGLSCASGEVERGFAAGPARMRYEKQPYLALLTDMGQPVQGAAGEGAEPGAEQYVSNDVWHFDTECIHDDGDYAAIIGRLAALSRGALVVSDLRDRVDVSAGKASVSFRCNGASYRWDATVADDWVDPTILDRCDALLRAGGSGRRFVHIDLQGQDCLIACMTEAEKDMLAERTRLDVRWLT